MSAEVSLHNPVIRRVDTEWKLERPVLIPIIIGLLTAASFLVLLYQQNRYVQYRIDAAEAWSAYQVKIIQTASEEDPNLKGQYTEEQDVLRQHGQDLKATSVSTKRAVTISTYAALLLLVGAGIAVFAYVADRIQVGYAGMLFSIIGVVLGVGALF